MHNYNSFNLQATCTITILPQNYHTDAQMCLYKKVDHASLSSLHNQSFCTSTHKIHSPPHGKSTLEQASACTWNLSTSNDDALVLAAFVLMCKRKPRKKKRDVWCKHWLWQGKPIPTLACWVRWKYIPAIGIIISEWMKKLIWTFCHS
jgi:hypothetical protein